MKLIDLREKLECFINHCQYYKKGMISSDFDNAMKVCKGLLSDECICIPHNCPEPSKLDIPVPDELLFLKTLEMVDYKSLSPEDEAEHAKYAKSFKDDPVFMEAWHRRSDNAPSLLSLFQ